MSTVKDTEKIEEVGQIHDKIVAGNHEYLQYWLNNTLFHWDFWTSFVLTIIPWLIWIKVRKKESTFRLMFVAFFVIIVSSFFDFIGTSFGLWHYTGKVLPLTPVYIPWDLCIFPVFILLLIQYKPERSAFIKAFIFGATSAFVGEPIFIWAGFYVMKHWSIFYSFPIYLLLYLSADRISRLNGFEKL